MIISYLIASILCAYGLAVILVEKRYDYPVRRFHLGIRRYLRNLFGRKFGNVLLCTICTSFWAALITDLVICLYSDFSYFLWPLSGFATAGLTWTVYEVLGAISPKDKEEEEYGLG